MSDSTTATTPPVEKGLSDWQRPSGPESGFTPDERREIIYRLQTVENLVQQTAEVVEFLRQAVVPWVEPVIEDGVIVTDGYTVYPIQEIHAFCQRLSATLDAMGQNPMFAAMLPPGVLGPQE